MSDSLELTIPGTRLNPQKGPSSGVDFSAIVGGAIAVLGVLVLAGWYLNETSLKSLSNDYVPMMPNTAVGFILAGLALFLSKPGKDATAVWLSRICALLTSLLGLVTIYQYLGGSSGIDRLLFQEHLQAYEGFNPGRMAPTTALNFLFLGIVLAFGDKRLGRIPIAPWLALPTIGITIITLLSYLYGIPHFYPAPVTEMALHTALGFVLLLTGVLARHKDLGFMAILKEKRLGGVLVRRMLPITVGSTITLGWLRLEGERAGLYPSETGLLLFATVNVIILMAVLLWMGNWVNRIQQENRTIQQELDALFETSVDPICIAGFDGYLKKVNPAWEKTLGFTAAELRAKPYLDFVHPEDRESTVAVAGGIARGHSIISFENRYQCKDGSYKWIQWNATPDTTKELIYAVARDVSHQKFADAKIRNLNEELKFERNRTERSLLQLQQRHELILESAGAGIYGIGSDGKASFVNHTAASLLGYEPEELLGKSLHPLVHHTKPDGSSYPDNECPIYSTFRDGKIYQEHHDVFWRRDGASIPVEYISSPILEDGKPVGAVVVFRDITQQREAELHREKMEAQLRHSQKIEAIGQLAGGIAHDFNNILMAIRAHCELLNMKLNPLDPLNSEVGEIGKAANRGASLTRQLLAFSRKQVLEPGVLNMNELLENMKAMLCRLVPENINLVFHLGPELDLVKGDRGQIEQVVMNLVVNARDAVSEGGRVTIETANEFLDAARAELLAAGSGHYVRISVSDSGHGMDEETRSRIFEPFFTTKKEGKGTGLGLSTVYGIVKQMKGDVWVYSEPGQGTVFKVYFPRTTDAPQVRPIAGLSDRSLSGNETILLVDDNESVRIAVSAFLELNGYRVLQARNGKDALQVTQNSSSRIDLIMTDVIMPEMGGIELANHVRALDPDTRLLFVSGYSENTVFESGSRLAASGYLSKPVSMRVLLKKIRDLLEGKESHGTNE